MVIYMTHPLHGTHIVYDHGEMERCKLSGWSVRDDTPKAAPKAADPVAVAMEENFDRAAEVKAPKVKAAVKKRKGS